MELGANVHQAENRGATALHIAARHGHVGCIETLLKLCANINRKDKLGYTALDYATIVRPNISLITMLRNGCLPFIKVFCELKAYTCFRFHIHHRRKHTKRSFSRTRHRLVVRLGLVPSADERRMHVYLRTIYGKYKWLVWSSV